MKRIVIFLLVAVVAFLAVSYCRNLPLNPKEKNTTQPKSEKTSRVTSENKPFVKISNMDGTVNDHYYVDLGLSVKWATCNIGATSPSDYGNHYAWGETSPKSEYVQNNSKTFGKDMGDISGNSLYDVARATWGATWRLPTDEEMLELIDNCTWTWTTQDGHDGYKVTGQNGNSIFLPAAGYHDGKSHDKVGIYGNYWCSTPNESNIKLAYGLDFNSSEQDFHTSAYDMGCFNRYCGFSVRPVVE